MNFKILRIAVILFFIAVLLPMIMIAGEVKEKNFLENSQNKILIKFYIEVNEDTKETIRKNFGVKVIKHLQEIGVEVWKLPEGKSVEAIIKELKNEPSVEHVEPDNIYKPNPSDSRTRALTGFGITFTLLIAGFGYLLPLALFIIMARENNCDEIEL